MNETLAVDLVDFATTSPEISTSKPPADRLLAGDPVTTVKNYFGDRTGRLFAGVWESTSGRWRVTYSEYEFCHITRGRVRIEGGHGKQWEFGPGASFVIPAGFAGIWEVLEPMTKLYVVYEGGETGTGDRG